MAGRYVGWVDYGSEGWKPTEFETLDEMRDALMGGFGYGSPVLLTKKLALFLSENP